ncbi:MAG: hypothetical protein ACTHKA_02505 [Anaerocolumna jejuensis]
MSITAATLNIMQLVISLIAIGHYVASESIHDILCMPSALDSWYL